MDKIEAVATKESEKKVNSQPDTKSFASMRTSSVQSIRSEAQSAGEHPNDDSLSHTRAIVLMEKYEVYDNGSKLVVWIMVTLLLATLIAYMVQQAGHDVKDPIYVEPHMSWSDDSTENQNLYDV